MRDRFVVKLRKSFAFEAGLRKLFQRDQLAQIVTHHLSHLLFYL